MEKLVNLEITCHFVFLAYSQNETNILHYVDETSAELPNSGILNLKGESAWIRHFSA